jgi:hypothetical protein
VSNARSSSDKVVGSAVPTLFGWLSSWDTTDTHNGIYTIRSMATDVLGHSTTSAGITVRVDTDGS